MNNCTLTDEIIQRYHEHLIQEEKSPVTIQKYLRDVRVFQTYASDAPLTKGLIMEYKKQLVEKGYAVRSVNSVLSSLNSLLEFMELPNCRVKCIRQQREIYCPEEKELSRAEYIRLLKAAKDRPWLMLVMETIGATGIRISELSYFTVEAVQNREVVVHCKNKNRRILVPEALRKLLLDYARENGIRTGRIFVTKGGLPMDRSNVWSAMKGLCKKAGVKESKVFPHNLRKLFARSFYRKEKDIAVLADILGHSSIDTTRIYIMSTGTEHRRKIENLGLIME